MSRVAFVVSHPIQYLSPWLRALSDHVDLQVFYCHRQDAAGQALAGFGQAFDWDVPLLDGYSYRWLRNVSRQPGVGTFSGCDTPEIAEALCNGRFDACVVSGWYLKSYVQAIRSCWAARVPVFVRGDSHLRIPRSPIRSALKYMPYRWWLSRIDAHLYVGVANREYLQSYGVADDRLFFAPHFVDNAFFRTGADRARQSGAAAAIRRAHDIPQDATVLLFVGKFIAQKRPADFVTAMARLADRRHLYALMVGSGPLEEESRAIVARTGARVAFAGFKNQTELPAFYAASDVLVLPSSSESWGLVVNEAMACGLPAVASDAVGCAPDLIENGRTGMVFPTGEVAALAEAMDAVATQVRNERHRVTEATTRTIERYCSDAAVAGLLSALAARMPDAQAIAR